MQLPALLPIVVGTLLVVGGGARAYVLGWKRRPAAVRRGGEGEGDGAGASDGGRHAAAGAGARHLRWGVIWVLMGLFLIVSTIVKRPG